MRIVMVSDLLPVDSLLNSVCKLSLIIIIKDTAKKKVFFCLTSSPLLLKWRRLSMMRGINHVDSKTNDIIKKSILIKNDHADLFIIEKKKRRRDVFQRQTRISHY